MKSVAFKIGGRSVWSSCARVCVSPVCVLSVMRKMKAPAPMSGLPEQIRLFLFLFLFGPDSHSVFLPFSLFLFPQSLFNFIICFFFFSPLISLFVSYFAPLLFKTLPLCVLLFSSVPHCLVVFSNTLFCFLCRFFFSPFTVTHYFTAIFTISFTLFYLKPPIF